eukprot:SAG11_NODE_11017_length_789_cov_1.991304_1_plen_89_part_10
MSMAQTATLRGAVPTLDAAPPMLPWSYGRKWRGWSSLSHKQVAQAAAQAAAPTRSLSPKQVAQAAAQAVAPTRSLSLLELASRGGTEMI